MFAQKFPECSGGRDDWAVHVSDCSEMIRREYDQVAI